MMGMNMEGLDTPFTWEYDETNGFLKQLSYPNGMVRKNTYHSRLNLLASISYEDAGTGNMLAGDAYQYDNLMRPTQRRDSWDTATPTITRYFTYNSRSELINDELQQRGNFAYQYDNIGNRKMPRNWKRKYFTEPISSTSIRTSSEQELASSLSMMQTVIRPGLKPLQESGMFVMMPMTGLSLSPVKTAVVLSFVTMTTWDDAFEKKVLVNGKAVRHSYYLYDSYLEVAELDLMHPRPVLVKSYLWDPTEPEATRILMMTFWKESATEMGEHFYFTHDGLKNVTSIFDEQQTQRARYEYAPLRRTLGNGRGYGPEQ